MLLLIDFMEVMLTFVTIKSTCEIRYFLYTLYICKR